MYKALKQAFLQYTPLSDAEWQQIESCFAIKLLPAKQFLLREGEVCRQITFINSGLLRY